MKKLLAVLTVMTMVLTTLVVPMATFAETGNPDEPMLWGNVYGSDQPALINIGNEEYYTYLCQEGEEINLTPSGVGGTFVWEELVKDTWTPINNSNEYGNQNLNVTKNSEQIQKIRCTVGETDKVFNYLLYKITLVNDTPTQEGEIQIVGKEHLGLMPSIFVNGTLYENIEDIVINGQNAIINLNVSEVRDVEDDAKTAFDAVGQDETHVMYFTVSVSKKISMDVDDKNGSKVKTWPTEAEPVYEQNENLQHPSFKITIPNTLPEKAEDSVIRVINFYKAWEEINVEEGTSSWRAGRMDAYENDGVYAVAIDRYTGYHEIKYVDRDEVYYYEEMMTNMGLAEYHCESGFVDPAVNKAYYNDFNRAMWYAIYADAPKDFTETQYAETVYALSIDQLYEMLSSLFDPRFDTKNMMGLKSDDRGEAIETLKETVKNYVPTPDDKDAVDKQYVREEDEDGNLSVVIDPELHFGDPDHVKFRMADLPDVDKANEVLLMGMFVHPVDEYEPYSETPRLIMVDGSKYELLSSPEMLINEENGTRKIVSFDLFDYLIETLENNEQQVSISPTVQGDAGEKPSMYEEVTVSTTIKDFQKLKAMKLQAKVIENPEEAKEAITATGVDIKENNVFSNDITLLEEDGTPVKNIAGLGLENKGLEVRIKIPADWATGFNDTLKNIRAYHIAEEDNNGNRSAELLYGKLRKINGEWYYILITDHFSEYTIAMLSDESIDDLDDVANPNAPSNPGQGTTPGGSNDPTQPGAPGSAGGSATTTPDNSPNTGDDFSAVPYIIVTIIALAGVAAAMLRRKTVK